MTLKSIADKAVADICKIVSTPIPGGERENISRIIEQVVIDTTISTSQRCADVMKVHSGPESDLAHKLTEQLKLEETALVTNLMGMR